MLNCSKCKKDKDFKFFSKKSSSKRGYSYICKECHNEYNRTKWYVKNASKQKESSFNWKKRNPIKLKALKYNTTEEFIIELIEKTNGNCESCGVPYQVIDHCHTTGKVRGLLCSSCNIALGLLKDNPEIIEKLKQYILKNK